MEKKNKKLKLFPLQELRTSNFQYKLEDGSHSIKRDERGYDISTIESKIIGGQLDIIACNMIGLMWKRLYLPNTKVINVSFVDSDTYSNVMDDNLEERIRLGTSHSFNHFGSSKFNISRSKYHSLETDDLKLGYITTALYESLLFYCDRFGIDSSPVQEAYEFMMKSDWYSPVKVHGLLNSKKTYAARVQTKPGYNKDFYRLAIRNMQTDEHSFFSLGEKDPMPISHEKIDNRQLILEGKERVPFIYTKEKWNRGNIFTFQWGELEKYEFHLEKMELIRLS